MKGPRAIIDKGFDDPEYARNVATVKRFLEKWTLDAGFQDAYRQDPGKALAETGLDIDLEAAKLLVDNDAAK